MHTPIISLLSNKLKTLNLNLCRRNIGIMSVTYQKVSDPIQQLFLDKIREYKQKSAGGKLVDATPEIERERQSELEKLARNFGGKKEEMNTFPTFKFEDPPLDDLAIVIVFLFGIVV